MENVRLFAKNLLRKFYFCCLDQFSNLIDSDRTSQESNCNIFTSFLLHFEARGWKRVLCAIFRFSFFIFGTRIEMQWNEQIVSVPK